jgi:cell division protein FtsB
VDLPVKTLEKISVFVREHRVLLLAFALSLLLLQDIFGTHGVLAMRRSQREAIQIQQEIKRLDEKNRELQEHVKALKTDPAAIERIAREEMGLARPGELIFKVPAKPGEPSSANTNPPGPPKK